MSMNFRILSNILFIVILIHSFSIHASSDQTLSDTSSNSKSLHGFFTMRLKTGFNLTTWWGASPKIDKTTNAVIPPYEHRTLLPGFTAGAALALRLHNIFSIQPEILLTTKGYKSKITEKTSGQTEIIKEIIRLTYLEFPVLFKLTLAHSAGYTHAYIGPVIGRKTAINSYISRDLDGKIYREIIPEAELNKIDKGFDKIDYGLMMGMTLDIGKGTDLFIVDIRYSLGLKEITKLRSDLISEGYTEQNIFKHKTNMISLNIGYALIF